MFFCVCDSSYLVSELRDLALPFLQILLQHLCFNVSAPKKTTDRKVLKDMLESLKAVFEQIDKPSVFVDVLLICCVCCVDGGEE